LQQPLQLSFLSPYFSKMCRSTIPIERTRPPPHHQHEYMKRRK
jgi:hypothetical protein